jgi:predicted DNA-binding protein
VIFLANDEIEKVEFDLTPEFQRFLEDLVKKTGKTREQLLEEALSVYGKYLLREDLIKNQAP